MFVDKIVYRSTPTSLTDLFACSIGAISNKLFSLRYSLLCQPVETGTSPREIQILDIVWTYYLSKIIDVMDTVFIILRKKYSQLSLLHIYHHAGMILLSWVGVNYVPGGQSLLLGVINCFIHVVMYGYYLLTLVDKRYTSSWWKKHITQLQMVSIMIILDHIQSLYHNFEYVWPDPRTRHYPLVYTPIPFIIIAIFLLFTYYMGPKYMRGRQPYRLEKIAIVYNVMQMILNGYLFITGIRLIYWPLRHSLLCQPVETGTSPREIQILDGVWLYYLIKMIDVIDSVFIILRKKYSQLSLLHIYHHAGMILVSWIGIKYVPGGQGVLMGVINCFVHVVMYGYYLLTLVDKRYTSSWWKKHITQLQMLQFITICVHHLMATVMNCGYPRFLSILLVLGTSLLIYLFAIFYFHAYIEPEKQKKKS
ncbi:hypothetical protein LSTR_LSTR012641 [Laodelphax striatellus]|uniref:Elongation of very long chain fatty acids protein n=1 Tax=Laodelphax striatellus TaxID=195883 RepID=A0A482XIQ8_LAOST|nr:hypothetical protein LSTR_LSTR012641 [Laodelphax striatellus]